MILKGNAHCGRPCSRWWQGDACNQLNQCGFHTAAVDFIHTRNSRQRQTHLAGSGVFTTRCPRRVIDRQGRSTLEVCTCHTKRLRHGIESCINLCSCGVGAQFLVDQGGQGVDVEGQFAACFDRAHRPKVGIDVFVLIRGFILEVMARTGIDQLGFDHAAVAGECGRESAVRIHRDGRTQCRGAIGLVQLHLQAVPGNDRPQCDSAIDGRDRWRLCCRRLCCRRFITTATRNRSNCNRAQHDGHDADGFGSDRTSGCCADSCRFSRHRGSLGHQGAPCRGHRHRTQVCSGQLNAATRFKQGLRINRSKQAVIQHLGFTHWRDGRFCREKARDLHQVLILSLGLQDELIALANQAQRTAIDGFLTGVQLAINHQLDGLAWLG